MVCRVLGRTMQVQPEGAGERDSLWTPCFQNPLYGPWTRSLTFSVKLRISEFDVMQRSFHISKLTCRFADLRMLTISFSRFTDDINAILSSLRSLLNLEYLTLVHTASDTKTDIQSIPSSFFQQLAHWPHLRSLRMSYAGNGLQGMALPSAFHPLIASPSFKELRLDLKQVRGWNLPRSLQPLQT